jgi:hypothetical protein
MSFYGAHIVPHLVKLSMRIRQLAPYREPVMARLGPGARIGVGSESDRRRVSPEPPHCKADRSCGVRGLPTGHWLHARTQADDVHVRRQSSANLNSNLLESVLSKPQLRLTATWPARDDNTAGLQSLADLL